MNKLYLLIALNLFILQVNACTCEDVDKQAKQIQSLEFQLNDITSLSLDSKASSIYSQIEKLNTKVFNLERQVNQLRKGKKS